MRSKYQLFHEIEITIMRLKFNFFMRLSLLNYIDQEVDTSIMRSKPKKALLANFDLMKIGTIRKSNNY